MNNFIEIGTIILGVCTLGFGTLQYFWQKKFDEKLRVYKNYLEIVALSTLSRDEQVKIQLVQKHILAKQELVLFAPRDIVEVAARIEPLDFGKNNEQKYLDYLSLINLMRLDLQRHNKRISEKYLRKLFG